MKTITAAFAMIICLSCSSNDGWTNLFNGKDLSGFNQLNGKAPFRAENGELIGTSVKGEPNSFLATEQDYGDFILEFDVRCDPALNSGVQFRSLSLPEYHNGRVHGYQCEIDPSDRAWSGGIYDEARRGWLVTLLNNPAGQAAYDRNGWNRYRIEAVGDNMRIWLNGVSTANLMDNVTPRGFIAFQVHGIGNKDENNGKEIRWKNIRIMTENVAANLMQGALAPEVNLVPNVLSEQEKANGWQLLFDGKTTSGWRGVGKETFPTQGWKIEDGQLIVFKTDATAHGGDIVTEKKYSAFELSVEFRLTKGANSGIKYFVIESKQKPGAAFGLEYQLLDDAVHPDATQYTTFPGSRTLSSLYDLIPAEHKRVNGIGQWNIGLVKVFPNNHVEHWLNGVKVLEYERGSAEFRERVKGSKYATPDYNADCPFGEAPNGSILLQDHGDEVAFRSIKIRELK